MLCDEYFIIILVMVSFLKITSFFFLTFLICEILLLFVAKEPVAEKNEEKIFKPLVDVRLTNLKLTLGPELRIVYPLILNFAVSGELELDGMAHPKYIRPKGILTFENGDVNLVATQVKLIDR